MEALNLCLSATCRPGDAVAVESPCFYACLQALERLGLRAVEIATHPREGIDLAALEIAFERHRPRACWVMSNFQNPLGGTMPEAKKAALVALCARFAVPLIEDDVYRELHCEGQRPALLKSFDADGGVLHCGSFSKSLAPGYRVGWVAPGRFLEPVVRGKLAASLATSLPPQLALARYLARGSYERHLRGLRATLRDQREAHCESLARALPAGTRIGQPGGGYFLWVELPDDVDALALWSEAMAAGISIAPGPMFSADGGFRNCMRINAGHPHDARIAAAVRQLGKLVRARKGAG
jgi:DNA-binding transcriptional MocR family regulator